MSEACHCQAEKPPFVQLRAQKQHPQYQSTQCLHVQLGADCTQHKSVPEMPGMR